MYYQMADWNEGHWLGGYPCFTQDDPRFSRSDYAACTNLLFQMDSCGREDAEILRGDTGVGNFLIAPEDLQQLDFSRILYNWDYKTNNISFFIYGAVLTKILTLYDY